MEHNEHSRIDVSDNWRVSDLLGDQDTADAIENKRITQLTGGPPNPPRDIEYYYRPDRPNGEELVVIGFMLGVVYLGVLTAWKEFVKSRV